MRLSLIVAMEKSRVIGRDGDLPWHLSADLKRFKKLTMGHHIIMGRKTFESIGRLLPGRTSVIITRQSDFKFDDAGCDSAVISGSLAEAIGAASNDEESFIIGGAEIYRLALSQVVPYQVNRIYLTEVAADVSGDAIFPELDRDAWRVVERSEYEADERNDHPHSFSILDRISAS